MLQLLYSQGKSPQCLLDRRLGGPQSWSGCSGEEKDSQLLLGFKLLIIQPVAQHCTTELLGLLLGLDTSGYFIYLFISFNSHL
jgi:hypothetical protein